MAPEPVTARGLIDRRLGCTLVVLSSLVMLTLLAAAIVALVRLMPALA